MNYLKQVNTFYELLLINPLSANSQCLYFCLMHINNKCNWLRDFKVANLTLMTFTGLNASALQRARNDLVQKGFIKYRKASGSSAGSYSIIEFEQQIEQQIEQQTDDKPITNRQQTDNKVTTLNKLKHKQNKNKKEIEKKSLVDIFNEACFNLPKIQKITDKRAKAMEKFLTEFSMEQFREICKKANSSDFLIGNNDRHWKADFDFLMRIDKATNVLEGKYDNATTDFKIDMPKVETEEEKIARKTRALEEAIKNANK